MRTLLLGDIGNRLDIADTERSIEAMRSSHVRSVQNLHARDQMIEVLRAELGQQKLAIDPVKRRLVLEPGKKIDPDTFKKAGE